MIKQKLSSLSVFYPCFNEAVNIPYFLKQAADFLPQIAEKFEVIVINDGSTDDTKQVVRKFKKQYNWLKLASHKKNKGYGAALKTGFAKSKYEWIFFTDGDLQFDIKQLVKFIEFIKEYNMIIGYRKNRADGAIRAFNAKLFKIYIDLLFRLHVKDIDCAFKLLKAEKIKALNLISTGAFTTSEFLYKLKKQGEQFKQIPVDHKPRLYGQPTGAKLSVIFKGVWEASCLYFKIKFKL